MPPLPELQAALGGALRGEASAGLWALFREPQAVAERRIAAYQRNVSGNWRSALASTYPVLEQLLGGRRFRALADHYIAAYPSNSGDLNQYGGALAALLANSALAETWPYLPDVARLEWALLGAYSAADAGVFDLAALAAVPVQAQAALCLHVWPAAILIESSWPLADIWQAHQLNEAMRDAALAGVDVAASGTLHYTLAVRVDGQVFPVALPAGEAAFLRATHAGQTLAEAIAGALSANAAFNAGAALQRLVALRVFTGFHESNHE